MDNNDDKIETLDLYPNPDRCKVCKECYYGPANDCACTDGSKSKVPWWLFWKRWLSLL